MKRLLLIPVCFVSLLVPVAVLAGSGEGFNGVVRTIETRYHVHATRIPFLGLISFVSRRATNSGASNIHVAEFEDFSGPFDGNELNDMVGEKLGPGWERVIRETNRNGDEQTLIYMRPEGARMGMFVVDADGRDLNVVQVSVDAEHVAQSVSRYEHHVHESMNLDGDAPE
jgi:hypothetical protein